jgi:hypothetical protein
LDYLVLFHITWQVNLQNWKSYQSPGTNIDK